jgi:hypothetical protein
MPEPSAVTEEEPIEVAEDLPVERSTVVSALPLREFLHLPRFELDLNNDPTPATEDEVRAWVASMHKNPKEWLPKLVAASPGTDMPLIRSQFLAMYAYYTNTSFSDFAEKHFRRPDAAAGTKPFPLRIEITAFLTCLGLAVLGLLILILSPR